MADWETRLRTARYTAGKRDGQAGGSMEFLYEDVSMSVERKTSAHDFIDVDGTYIQDFGSKSKKFPMRMYFSGPDHDLEADAFVNILGTGGRGKLDHPMYGVFSVIPFGVITRRDDLVQAANQTIMEVSFWQTNGSIFEASPVFTRSDLEVARRNSSIAFKLDSSSVSDRRDSTSFKLGVVRNEQAVTTKQIEENLAKHAKKDPSAWDKFKAGLDGLKKNISERTSDYEARAARTLTIQNQILSTMRFPLEILNRRSEVDRQVLSKAREVFGILRSYQNIVSNALNIGIFDGDDISGNNRVQYESKAAQAEAALICASEAVAIGTYSSREEAVIAVGLLSVMLDDFTAWRESNIASLCITDTGEAYCALLTLATTSAGYTLSAADNLPRERQIVLDRPRSIIDLSFELYGETDTKLDLLMATNDITGSEIFELSVGRTVKYYA